MYDYDSSSGPTSYGGSSTTTDPAIMLAFFGFFAIFAIVVYVIYSIFLGMIFKKAGIESWKAWVPVYSTWVLLEMGGQPGWWAILSLIPVVSIVALVFMYIAMYHVGIGFGKEGVFVLFGIFLPLVWVIWLAVDKSVWKPIENANLPNSSNPPSTPSQSAAM